MKSWYSTDRYGEPEEIPCLVMNRVKQKKKLILGEIISYLVLLDLKGFAISVMYRFGFGWYSFQAIEWGWNCFKHVSHFVSPLKMLCRTASIYFLKNAT